MRQNKDRDEAVQAAGTDGHLALDTYLPFRFSVIAERTSRHLAREYETRFGLGQYEWRIMHVLSEGAARSTQEVIALTSLDRLRVSRAAIRLEDKGLIERAAAPGDQRAHLLRLTAKGRKIYRQIVPIARAFQARLAEALTPSQRDSLAAILDRLDAVLTGLPG
jgi:DNA-binding MarR family transcriptional regulator